MSWEEAVAGMDRVIEAYEVVGVFEFLLNDPPLDLAVRVLKDIQGRYWGACNYQIQNPGQASPYFSANSSDTLEEALRSSLSGFLMFWPDNEDEQKRTKLVRNEAFYRYQEAVTQEGANLLE